MTYDDVTEIKAMLTAITALLQRMANTLDRVEDHTLLIGDTALDVAAAVTPTVDDAE